MHTCCLPLLQNWLLGMSTLVTLTIQDGIDSRIIQREPVLKAQVRRIPAYCAGAATHMSKDTSLHVSPASPLHSR